MATAVAGRTADSGSRGGNRATQTARAERDALAQARSDRTLFRDMRGGWRHRSDGPADAADGADRDRHRNLDIHRGLLDRLWLARGTWRPLADTTAAFIDVSIRRRESYMGGATFGMCLYVLQLVFVALLVYFATNVGAIGVLRSPQMIVIGWIGLPSVLAGGYWFRRRQRAELDWLHELKRQLQGD